MIIYSPVLICLTPTMGSSTDEDEPRDGGCLCLWCLSSEIDYGCSIFIFDWSRYGDGMPVKKS